MSPSIAAIVAVAAAYLVGSCPFGLIVARVVKGIDIRTVGSGNIGATNVGRTLGFRYFVLVFILDVLKGFLPTFLANSAVNLLSGSSFDDARVLAALASVLGHNYPIYLKFKGGKGVATSLGAIVALDPRSALGAAIAFAVVLFVSRFVSLSSIAAALAYLAGHFWLTAKPWSRSEIALSLLSIGLVVMLIVRHRSNLSRIAAGSEPKVNFRRKRPEGFVRPAFLIAIAAVATAGGLAWNAARKNILHLEDLTIREVSRLSTGLQRAERAIFLSSGKVAAVACPRYGKIVTARVADDLRLESRREISVEGRPVALARRGDGFLVLQRPHGDARHLEEAWWETFDAEGSPIGSKHRVGWDPDDFAVSSDGRFVYVLLSGFAEGETNRPAPSLVVFDLATGPPVEVGRVEFNEPRDDPARLALSPDGKSAAVTIQGSNRVAFLDLSEPSSPRFASSQPLGPRVVPESVVIDERGRTLVAEPEGSALWVFETPRSEPVRLKVPGGVGDVSDRLGNEAYRLLSLPGASGVAAVSIDETPRVLGTLPLKGAANLGNTRPLGVAVSPAGDLAVVTNRAGGQIYLLAIDRR